MIPDLLQSIPIYAINALVSKLPLAGSANLTWADQVTETLRALISWGAIFLNSSTDVVVILTGFVVAGAVLIAAAITRGIVTLYYMVKPFPL